MSFVVCIPCFHCGGYLAAISPTYIPSLQLGVTASSYHLVPANLTYHATTSRPSQPWNATSLQQVYQAPPQVPSGNLLPVPAGTQQFIKYEEVGGGIQPVMHYRFPASSSSLDVTSQGSQQSLHQQRRGFNIYHGPDTGTPPPLYSTLPPAAFPFPTQDRTQDQHQNLPHAPTQAEAAPEQPPGPSGLVQALETGGNTNARGVESGTTSTDVDGTPVIGVRVQETPDGNGRVIGTLRLRGGDASPGRR